MSALARPVDPARRVTAMAAADRAACPAAAMAEVAE